jgi:hypothetical protein
MGFLDKAKQMAEQAQAKLDEAQKQFNAGQSGATAADGPVVEYDKHGRPIAQSPPATATPPHGDPLPQEEAPPATRQPGAPLPDTAAPEAVADEGAPDAPPARAGSQAAPEDRNHPSYAPPTLTSGDPLAG